MPRKPRIFSSTGIYHVILRSVNQHIIFEEDSDYQKFLFIMSDCKKKYDTDIYAYCLMDNHVHLLLFSSPENLPGFFQSLGTRFARWYNNKYTRSGHLFQERYHSSIIENESHFLSALLYIHNNPVKAGICPIPSDYRWSSFKAFYGEKNPLVNVTFSYNVAGTKDSLLHYFAEKCNAPDDVRFSDDHREIRRFLTDEQALAAFKLITGLSSASMADSLTKTIRDTYVRLLSEHGATIKQIARLMDISLSTVKRACKTTWK